MDGGRHVVHSLEAAIIQRFLFLKKLCKQLRVFSLHLAFDFM